MHAEALRACTVADPHWSRAVRALWYEAQGDWHRAHDELQDDGDLASDWVHAYLHRVEGDTWNAAYWYRRAGQPVPSADMTLAAEWLHIATAILPQSAE
jgi:hypothetical protein